MANKNLKSIKFPGLSDTYVVPQVDSTLTQTGRPADAKATGDAISALGDSVDTEIDALKEDLSTLDSEGTVPTSEQMLSDNYTEDSVPYHFRKTASDNADREKLEIVGGSVAWNQIYAKHTSYSVEAGSVSGADISVDSDGYLIVTGTNTEDVIIRVAPIGDVLPANTVVLHCCDGYNGFDWARIGFTFRTQNYYMTKHNTAFTRGVRVKLTAGVEYNIKARFTCHDVTSMFGSTIADHIYALEQATAGAGVALFKSLFPKDYYAYDAGSMQSVSGLSEHKTVGFNVWDEEWENGRVSKTSGETATGNGIRSKNFIRVMPNTEYYFRKIYANYTGASSVVYAYYDENKTFISGGEAQSFTTFTIPSGVAYMKFCLPTSAAVAAYANDICINISDASKNGTYEPYDGHTYALDDSLTLRGIPTLVDGKIKFDGDIYSPSGKVTRRYDIVDLGTLTWEYISDNAYFRATLSNGAIPVPGGKATALCSKYIIVTVSSLANWTTDKSILFAATNISSTSRIAVKDSAYTDAAVFKTAMSGVYLVYELATPTTETADPYINPQVCHYDGTEEFVSTGIVPIGHNTKYPDNLRMKLDNLPWNFASLIAPTESGFKATRNYTTGALLIVNNVLYKATANIANNATITPNTNVTATTLAEVIAAL